MDETDSLKYLLSLHWVLVSDNAHHEVMLIILSNENSNSHTNHGDEALIMNEIEIRY